MCEGTGARSPAPDEGTRNPSHTPFVTRDRGPEGRRTSVARKGANRESDRRVTRVARFRSVASRRAVRRSPSHSPPFPLITFAPQAGVRAETERYAITERGRRQRDEESGEARSTVPHSHPFACGSGSVPSGGLRRVGWGVWWGDGGHNRGTYHKSRVKSYNAVKTMMKVSYTIRYYILGICR